MLKRLALTSLAVAMSIVLSSCALIAAKKGVDAIKEDLVSTDSPKPTSSIPDKQYGTVGEFFGKVGDEINEFAEDLGASLGEAGNMLADELAGKTSEDATPEPTNIPTPTGSIDEVRDIIKQGVENINEGDSELKPTDTDINVPGIPSDDETSDEPVLEGPYHISYVVDGDTCKFEEWGDTRIRYIGIDTPESVAREEYTAKNGKQNTQEGKDASSFMKEYLPKGTVCYIERDVETQDRYGRELVYLYAEKDGGLVFINELLLKEGLAKLFTLQPNSKYADNKFYEAQKYARENGKGFWGTGFFEEE
ncbi:MAG: thermonuclease family protein [Lachnospiraceae bacterium]|nr:thermonuclease family protein [Lachnospiraceae bacterium]